MKIEKIQNRIYFTETFVSLFVGALLALVFLSTNTLGSEYVKRFASASNQYISFTQVTFFIFTIYAYCFISLIFTRDFWKEAMSFFSVPKFHKFTQVAIGFVGFYFIDHVELQHIIEWSRLIDLKLFSVLIVFFPSTLILSHLANINELLVFTKKLFTDTYKKSSKSEKGVKLVSKFYSDRAIVRPKDDKLGFNSRAEAFAENVYDNGASESLIFGIDAPWGSGKTSFLGLCNYYWQQNYGDKVLLHNLSSLDFNDDGQLLQQFAIGLKDMFDSNSIYGNQSKHINRYLRRIDSARFSLFGFSFATKLKWSSNDSILEALSYELLKNKQKIVIVVDDLDRSSFSKIKQLLKLVKVTFNLSNISYIFCYDTKNILLPDGKQMCSGVVRSYIEKYINTKINLPLKTDNLLQYFDSTVEERLASNSLLSNSSLIQKIREGLKIIYGSNEYIQYASLLGNPRKVKNIINITLLLNLDHMNIKDTDIRGYDLLHLILIYINYPDVFQDIYSSETKNKSGLFSCIEKPYKYKHNQSDDDTTIYVNSNEYIEYLTNCNRQEEMILNNIFCVKAREIRVLEHDNIDVVSEKYTGYACFNDDRVGRRILTTYLDLICEGQTPITAEQNTFFVKLRNEVFKGNIEHAFKELDLHETPTEEKHIKLWRAIQNGINANIELKQVQILIRYAIKLLPSYSSIEAVSYRTGSRRHLIYTIVSLINKLPWLKNIDKNKNKMDGLVYDSIFRESKPYGAIKLMLKNRNLILGFHDVLIFHLNICIDRNSSVNNISNSLIRMGNPEARTDGNINDLLTNEMREVSQYIFDKFKTSFIIPKIDIFSEIEKLSNIELSGIFYESHQDKSKLSDFDFSKELLIQKFAMFTFIPYQLGSDHAGSGIRCGYYYANKEEETKCGRRIRDEMSEYLFGVCFSKENNENAYHHFVKYLLVNMSRKNSGGDLQYVFKIDEFTKVLKEDALIEYWNKNSKAIKELRLEEDDTVIHTHNYTASFTEDLHSLYKSLDDEAQIRDPELNEA